jgi:hypothetical protein
MKRIIILVLCYFIVTNATAQPVTHGYYITLASDTVLAAMKVPETLFNEVSTLRLNNKIKIIDSGGRVIKMKPASIKGFGFTRKNTDYAFISKPVKNKRNKFFEVISSGNNARLFYYSFYKNSGKVRHKKEMFIIEKPVDTDLTLKFLLNRKNIRKTLKEFYNSTPGFSQVIDSSFISFRHLKNDLKKIVDDINKL